MSRAAIDTQAKYDRHGKISFMVRSGGYVMVRRPGAMPFVLSEKEWGKLPSDPESGQVFAVTHGLVFKDNASLPAPLTAWRGE